MIAPIITIKNNAAITNSSHVAEYFGKTHAHVLRDIDALILMEPSCASNFGFTLTETAMPKGGTRKDRAVNMTRDGFTLLAMGFTGKKALGFKLQYQKGVDGEYGGVTKLFSEAIRKNQPEIKPELADKMGFAIADRMYKLGNGQEYTAARALSGEDMDDLRHFLTETKANGDFLSDAEIEEIMGAVNRKRSEPNKDAGGSSRLTSYHAG